MRILWEPIGMAVRILVVVLAGCGRLGFDPQSAAGTADASDAGVDTPACTSFSAWSTPDALSNLNTPTNDFGGQITGDGLTLTFDSNRDGTDDLFVATRPDRASAFGAPQKLLELDTSSNESDASPSPDGLELMFYQDSDNCVLDARRATPTDLWSIPTVTTICGAGGAFIAHDGLTLYYNTLVDSFDEGVLTVATRATTDDDFAPGTPIAELAGGATKGYPAVTADQLTMYFESDDGGGTSLDLWQATRASPGAAWGTPSKIAGIDSLASEGDVSITADGLELFFESDAAGSPDLYVATRTCQ